MGNVTDEQKTARFQIQFLSIFPVGQKVYKSYLAIANSIALKTTQRGAFLFYYRGCHVAGSHKPLWPWARHVLLPGPPSSPGRKPQPARPRMGHCNRILTICS